MESASLDHPTGFSQWPHEMGTGVHTLLMGRLRHGEVEHISPFHTAGRAAETGVKPKKSSFCTCLFHLGVTCVPKN